MERFASGRERDEHSLFHRKRTINSLVKRKSVKYQLFDDEKSWAIDFALELKCGTSEMLTLEVDS